MPKAMTIGALARRMGVETSALRFYERQGLMTSERLSNGYRIYTEDAVNALRFVCQAKELGFSLEQIGEILRIRRRDVQPCAQVKGLIERNLAEVERKIGELSRLRRELKALARSAARPGASAAVCPIIEAAKPRSDTPNRPEGTGRPVRAKAIPMSRPQPGSRVSR
jgi:DNA-binding transcriptional MerR regulator